VSLSWLPPFRGKSLRQTRGGSLRNVTSNQQLDLQGDGAALIAYDENGAGTVTIAATSPAGGSITIYGKGASAKARVNIGISHVTNGGSVAVLDAAGNPNGSLGR
jgi:hypothetical protein